MSAGDAVRLDQDLRPHTPRYLDADDLKERIDAWHRAMRRCAYLESLREAMPPGLSAQALDKEIAQVAAEVERLQRAVLGGGPGR